LLEGSLPVVALAEGVVEKVASTVTPQPVLAVARTCDVPLTSLTGATFVVVGARLADPGNVGTILRIAEASGADAVVLTEGSVDPFNPKVVRASAGALFHVNLVTGGPLSELAQLGAWSLVGATAESGRSYTSADWTRSVALVLGNEAHGLSLDERAQCSEFVRIPHRGRAESLNVAMAAAVLCFEVARFRPL
jgi:RNA methyltransferase, TrmH family